ncbi:arginase family protein [Nonomuraea glycinis]|uniref:arginase family protein n=1 Tax=Nonomuraea glycinis TaxID=2047744 RepID=UPI001CD96207|nr:arginase family protein [Nonomuraea glycinis]MCA2180549.1 arginase family protein [Nonomuraea glycinis]
MTVVQVPQWRGSGAPTAERLREGARLLATMVPADERVLVEVEDDLVSTAARVREAIAQVDRRLLVDGGLLVVAGGDCGIELEPVAAAQRRHGERLVVVWFDAHGDLNTPESSPSGAFHGMVLRALTGEGPPGLVATPAVDPGRVVLAGVRDLDPAEAAFVKSAGVRHVRPAEAAFGGRAGDVGALVDAIAAAGGPGEPVVYVHIDLDVLEPEIFASVGTPSPGGLRPDQLLALVTAVAERFGVVGLGITEYEPSRAADQELLEPLVAGLVEVCARSGRGTGG